MRTLDARFTSHRSLVVVLASIRLVPQRENQLSDSCLLNYPRQGEERDTMGPTLPCMSTVLPDPQDGSENVVSDSTRDSDLHWIAVDKIDIDPENLNGRPPDEDQIQRLADSIEQWIGRSGIQVYRVGTDRYRILIGEHRFHAVKRAEQPAVRCFVRDVEPTRAERIEAQLRENHNRRNESLVGVAEKLQWLINEEGWTHARCAALFGTSEWWVRHVLLVLKMPATVQQLVLSGQLKQSHLVELRPLIGSRRLAVIARRAATEQWTRETLHREVTNVSGDQTGTPPASEIISEAGSVQARTWAEDDNFLDSISKDEVPESHPIVPLGPANADPSIRPPDVKAITPELVPTSKAPVTHTTTAEPESKPDLDGFLGWCAAEASTAFEAGLKPQALISSTATGLIDEAFLCYPQQVADAVIGFLRKPVMSETHPALRRLHAAAVLVAEDGIIAGPEGAGPDTGTADPTLASGDSSGMNPGDLPDQESVQAEPPHAAPDQTASSHAEALATAVSGGQDATRETIDGVSGDAANETSPLQSVTQPSPPQTAISTGNTRQEQQKRAGQIFKPGAPDVTTVPIFVDSNRLRNDPQLQALVLGHYHPDYAPWAAAEIGLRLAPWHVDHNLWRAALRAAQGRTPDSITSGAETWADVDFNQLAQVWDEVNAEIRAPLSRPGLIDIGGPDPAYWLWLKMHGYDHLNFDRLPGSQMPLLYEPSPLWLVEMLPTVNDIFEEWSAEASRFLQRVHEFVNWAYDPKRSLLDIRNEWELTSFYAPRPPKYQNEHAAWAAHELKARQATDTAHSIMLASLTRYAPAPPNEPALNAERVTSTEIDTSEPSDESVGIPSQSGNASRVDDDLWLPADAEYLFVGADRILLPAGKLPIVGGVLRMQQMLAAAEDAMDRARRLRQPVVLTPGMALCIVPGGPIHFVVDESSPPMAAAADIILCMVFSTHYPAPPDGWPATQETAEYLPESVMTRLHTHTLPETIAQARSPFGELVEGAKGLFSRVRT